MKAMTYNLYQKSQGRQNNLNLLRLIAAVLVIYCHAYPLCLGAAFSDPLDQLTKHQLSSGGLAVSVFFFFGGFLISKSIERTNNTKKYFCARIKRIIPPLAFVVFITAFMIGPVISEFNITQYFTDKLTYRYLLNSVFILQHDLPGVFIHNIYGPTVNGALWTLPIEFLCYIMCFIFFKLRLGTKKAAKWTLIPVIFFYLVSSVYLPVFSPLLSSALRPAMLFYIGMICYIYRENIRLNPYICALSVFVLVIAVFGGLYHDIILLICFPYILLYLGFGTKNQYIPFKGKLEFSYGMYLCAWPVQQILCMLSNNSLSPLVNTMITIPISAFCGIMIYYLIEKPLSAL